MLDSAYTLLLRLNGDAVIWAAIILGLALAILLAFFISVARQNALRRHDEELRVQSAQAAEASLAELRGRLSQLTEIVAARQEELTRSLNERLDRISQRVGTSLDETGRRTSDDLAKLYERLSAIDSAQRNIAELSGQFLSLQDILGNKQARGAFGQVRMESIIDDALPKGAYSFQATLSNGKRPDCVIQLPNAAAKIVVDAKFPLESFEALRAAQGETAVKAAQSQVRRDVGKHIEDMAAKYFIPGETQDTAMMFIPAESIYAELHEGFPDLIQQAHRRRIMIVSPNMLMLAVQTMMAIFKDLRTQEQAGVIQREVAFLLEDLGRLRERVLDFQRHLGTLGPDLEKILASTEKIGNRARRIESLDLEEPKTGEGPADLRRGVTFVHTRSQV